MLINSDCTIYSRIRDPSSGQSKWERQYVPECWWFNQAKISVTNDGPKSADVLTIRIPDLSVKVKNDDVIVKGDCQVKMETVKDIVNYQYFKAVTVNYNEFGDNPHIKVVGV